MGTRVVADRAQRQVERRMVGANVTWTRAVTMAPPNWTIAQAANVRYIRDRKLGADKVYPDTTNRMPIAGRSGLDTERRWSDQIGEYTWIELSPLGGGAQIIHTGGQYQSFTPPAGLSALNLAERHHVDIGLLEASLRERLSGILITAANTHHLNPAHLNQADHVDALMKPLNFVQAKGFASGAFGNWYAWKEGVFTTITTGAGDMATSIAHWKAALYPIDPTQVTIRDIRMTASDLHERGLGVVFVDFTKPVGGLAEFTAQTNFTAVIKPEDRAIEKALFGTAATSLAGRVERLAGLLPNEAIARIRMETHALYGSLIEFIPGELARGIGGGRPPSDAMREAMAFAYISGLSDVHRDNVIYVGNKPYLIDADNALNAARIGLTTKPQAEVQSGFAGYSRAQEQTEREAIRDAPLTSTAKIMQALVSTGPAVPIVDAVRKTFAGKTGRVVPIATNGWAQLLRYVYPTLPVGLVGDAPEGTSRWALSNLRARQVPLGRPGEPEPGLQGETGIAQAGRVYNQAAEAGEIKTDYDAGKIPFFTYEYDTGHVQHNGTTIWHGKPLAETLELLLTRFPHQRGITDI
jgi:hypothetical protein